MIPLGMREDEFELAFAEFQRFGPRRRISIQTRWQEILPELLPAQIPGLLAICNEIQSFATAIAGRVVDGGLSEDLAAKQISGRFPFLTAAQLRRTLSQACYFAAK
jgi:hypothetical protein